MTKNEIVEGIRGMVLRSEAVDDNTKVLHFKRVEKAVESAFAELMQTLAKKDEAEIEGNYVKSYYGKSVYTADGVRYVPITDDIVPLPNGKGLWFCKPSGSNTLYPRTTTSSHSLFASLPMGGAINDTWVKLGNPKDRGLSIIFKNVGDSYRGSIALVDYGVVRSFSSYGDTENIHLPSESYSFIIEKCLAWFGQRKNDVVNQGQ